MTKQALRKQYKQQRLAISSKEKLKLDDLMLLQFQQLYFDEAVHTLLTYWPMANMNEPNMHLYSSYLRHSIPNLQMAYPVADFETGNMQAWLINEDTIYTTNEYGITEPKIGSLIEASAIDIVFVPLLVCDEQGYRVGYGKGFYDKYLAKCKEEAVFIGFSYFEPVYKIEDAHQFDVPLNYCITPQQVYEF
jgi:5-formyltetrahydrofolate cyclo-ligase